jgi:transposase
VSDAALADSPHVDVEQRLAAVIAEMDRVTAERDEYKKLYLKMLELCRKLERGIVGPKSEKLSANDAQVTMSLLGMLLGREAAKAPAPVVEEVRTHARHKPTGRRPLPEDLPRVDLEVLPLEVQHGGLDAFDLSGVSRFQR